MLKRINNDNENSMSALLSLWPLEKPYFFKMVWPNVKSKTAHCTKVEIHRNKSVTHLALRLKELIKLINVYVS